MATASPQLCPSCGAERPSNGPLGLCPRCLLRGGLDSDALALSDRGELGATVDLSGPPGVLETLAASVGPLPRVLLRDTDLAPEPPVHRPGSPEAPPEAGRLRLLGEIARGGMGAVLKGRDEDLGRDLAVKVLLERHRDNPELIRRFVEEAQIGGQLQHPGVVPIYELGAFADHRPYFAMKLVKGQTLAALLAGRADPADSLPRFLGIFEQVAQTVAYAHARGVIHRDLKPSNVMVGSFGEVQVMDWGLAKVLARGGVADEAAGPPPEAETVVATARSGSDADASRVGSVMGTPAYMPPEQARGEIDRVDERADVFALGSILVEILTGTPAFTGRTSAEVQRQAARGDTADALARLDSSGADPDLIALARACLAAEPEARPRDARAVADAVNSHLAGVQERLKAAELARVEAQTRAAEERKRRKLTVALAASVLLLAGLGGGAGLWQYDRQNRADRQAGDAYAVADAALGRARANPDDPAAWADARARADALAARVESAPVRPDLAARARALQKSAHAEADAAARDRALIDGLIADHSARAELGDAGTAAALADTFARYGLVLAPGSGAAASARPLAGRPEPVRVAAAAGLDEWAMLARQSAPETSDWRRPLELAGAIDPDPDRQAVRRAWADDDRDALRRLAEPARADRLQPAALSLLANTLGEPDVPAAVAVLRRGLLRFPRDAGLNERLGYYLSRRDPEGRAEAITYYSVARALQPANGHTLAHLLADRGRGEEAEAIFRELAGHRAEPAQHARHLGCLGRLLRDRGRSAEAGPVLSQAVAACREAIRLKPDDALAHFVLGNALRESGDRDGAVAAYREAIRLRPDYAEAHNNLGNPLGASGDPAGAVAACREAIRLKPDLAEAHNNLGAILCDIEKDYAAAAAEFRAAIRLKPDYAEARYNLGVALRASGDLPGAVAAYRAAIRLKPELAEARYNLGVSQGASGDPAGAVAACREVIRLKPDDAGAHNNLAFSSPESGDPAAALAEVREALRIDPAAADALGTLAETLVTRGQFAEAVPALERTAGRLEEVKQLGYAATYRRLAPLARRLAESDAALDALAAGTGRDRDELEALDLAALAAHAGELALAARLYDAALAVSPARARRHGLAAAKAAARAGSGQGQDDPPPDDAERAALRGLALGWLRADLAARSPALTSDDPAARAAAAEALRLWQSDPDLAAVRDPDALDKLPEAERSEWRALWERVGKLLEQARP